MKTPPAQLIHEPAPITAPAPMGVPSPARDHGAHRRRERADAALSPVERAARTDLDHAAVTQGLPRRGVTPRILTNERLTLCQMRTVLHVEPPR